MQLISLEITPLGSHGWKSEILVFGEEITHLLAPNGAGKTPIIESIIYSLGYPIKFRDDIYQNCNSVILTTSINGTNIIFKRKIDRTLFDIEINGEKYADAQSFSKAFFALINKQIQSLISTTNTKASPYISQFLYLNYIDQDSGYIQIYNMPERFIKDQYSEMVRIALNLPAKNIFDQKQHQIKLENELKLIERRIFNLKEQLNILKSNDIISGKIEATVQAQLKEFSFEYDQLLSLNSTKSANVAYENIILIKQREVQSLQYDINEIEKRQFSFKQISDEIQMELDTLTLNEQAKRLFSSYIEICNNKLCGLFASSEKIYSKNLLYLKDQIKDLKHNYKFDAQIIATLQEKKLQISTEIDEIKSSFDQNTAIQTDRSALDILSTEIHQLRLQNFLFKEINTFEKEYITQLNRQKTIADELETIKSRSSTSSQVATKKYKLKELFLYWLDILDTANISREISFDSANEFVPILGREKINIIKGSTKTRCILAYKAAMFELMSTTDNNLQFFILDTPKQQELDDIDLDAYIKELKKLAVKNKIQIIFSSTDYFYDDFDDKDIRWLPTFTKNTNKGPALRYLIE